MAHDWSDFFVATAGACAALAGLIIVAISVNIRTILAIPGMTSRGATTIASLVLVVIVCCAGLIPVQPLPALGFEGGVASVLALALAVRSLHLAWRAADRSHRLDAALKGLLGVVPISLVLAGCVLAAFAAPAGLVVIAAGTLVSVAASSTNAWVLLVEVLR